MPSQVKFILKQIRGAFVYSDERSVKRVSVGPVIDVKQLVTVVMCGTILVTSYKYMSSVFLVVVIVCLFVLD